MGCNKCTKLQKCVKHTVNTDLAEKYDDPRDPYSPRYRGNKRIATRVGRKKVIGISFSEEEHCQLKAVAYHHGFSLNQTMRMLLRRECATIFPDGISVDAQLASINHLKKQKNIKATKGTLSWKKRLATARRKKTGKKRVLETSSELKEDWKVRQKLGIEAVKNRDYRMRKPESQLTTSGQLKRKNKALVDRMKLAKEVKLNRETKHPFLVEDISPETRSETRKLTLAEATEWEYDELDQPHG